MKQSAQADFVMVAAVSTARDRERDRVPAIGRAGLREDRAIALPHETQTEL
jgi:hypothetical protein